MGRQRALVGALLGAIALLLASCASGASSAPPSTAHHRVPGAGTPPGSATTGPATTTSTTVPAEPGWSVLATEPTGVAVDERTVAVPDGTTIRVIRFRAGQVRFDLHVGTQDPPVGALSLPADAQPSISATESHALLAAFNGGFKATASAGGFEVDGHVLTPLRSGLASLAIDAGGHASIGVWGASGFPAPGSDVVSVRQNLAPLVIGGVLAPDASYWPAWGATLGGGPDVARSALGEDSAGDLLYAASMSTVPIDLADALVASGAVIAMELDINPEWVQADVAPTPGGALSAEVPGQIRPSNQYIAGWSRDFIAVLSR